MLQSRCVLPPVLLLHNSLHHTLVFAVSHHSYKPATAMLQVRQGAGLLLKNNLKDQYARTSEELRRYIKVFSRAALIRTTAKAMAERTSGCRPHCKRSLQFRRTDKSGGDIDRKLQSESSSLHLVGDCTAMRTQAALLQAIASPSRPLRQTAGTSVAVIVALGGLQDWPELLPAFLTCLESSQPALLEGALDALYKVRTTS